MSDAVADSKQNLPSSISILMGSRPLLAMPAAVGRLQWNARDRSRCNSEDLLAHHPDFLYLPMITHLSCV